MRLKSKAALALAAAAVLVAASAVTAFAVAAQQSVALIVGDAQGSGFSGSYGDEVVLQPASMSSIEVPGDKIHFQALVQNVDASGTPQVDASGTPVMSWIDFQDFEDIQLEDTNTVQPFSFNIGADDKVILADGTSISPFLAQPHPNGTYEIRAEYRPSPGLDASGNVLAGVSTSPKSLSETETVTLIKNTGVRVSIAAGAVRKAGTRFTFRVSPGCGVSQVRVQVVRSGQATRTYTLTTDENGVVSSTLKLGSRTGSYKVTARFLGNIFGSASGTASKTVRALR